MISRYHFNLSLPHGRNLFHCISPAPAHPVIALRVKNLQCNTLTGVPVAAWHPFDTSAAQLQDHLPS